MGDVLVLAPDKEHTLELLAKAKELAGAVGGKVVVAAFGEQATAAKDFGAHGADRVLTNTHELLKGVQVEPWADALHQLIEKVRPSVVLVGSHTRTKDAAARVSTRLEVGVGSDWHKIDVQGGRLVGERTYFSGNSMLGEKLVKDPQIALVPTRVFEAKAAAGAGAVEAVELTLNPPKAKVGKAEAKASEGVNLEDADVVVAVGRGIKKKEDLSIATDLAKAIGGQVGCTRPIAADLKWLGDEHWIGLSGHEVKPKAYIGLGVSGQIQHVAGMRGSKLIIAINKDEEAPMVKISDYAIVDDLYKVVPPLIAEIKRIRGG